MARTDSRRGRVSQVLRPVVAMVAVLLVCSGVLSSCSLSSMDEAPAESEEGISQADAILSGEGADSTEEDSGNDAAIDLEDADKGVSPEGLEPTGTSLEERMDTYLDRNIPTTTVPGVAVAVVDADGVRYLNTYGDCPGPDAPFIIGSLSKSFAALAIMQLVEQGRLDLDAPASRYTPGYDVPDQVTVRSLLNQTSGFKYYDALSEAADGQVGDTLGTFSYSNANYDLLGRIVEGVSGEDYAHYLDEHVLGPLGMSSSSADPARAEALGMAPGHRDWFGLHVADGFQHAQGDDAWGGPASGYMAASVQDMATYLRMYLNGGKGENGARVLSDDSVHRMFFDRVPDPGGGAYYGMGWTSFYWDDGELVLSHDGQVENYVASMCLLPERGVGVIVLGNANDNAGGNNRFFDLASAVVSVAIGATPDPVDVGWTAQWRQRSDVLYVSVMLACIAPLLLLGRWRHRLATLSRPPLLVQGLALHAALPAALLALPLLWNTTWRDLLTFGPDTALVLIGCAALLVITGVAKLAIALRWRSDAPPPANMR